MFTYERRLPAASYRVEVFDDSVGLWRLHQTVMPTWPLKTISFRRLLIGPPDTKQVQDVGNQEAILRARREAWELAESQDGTVRIVEARASREYVVWQRSPNRLARGQWYG